MHFVVIAYDSEKPGTLEKRMSVREQHLSDAKKMKEEGRLLYACGMLNNKGELIGSVMIVDFPDRETMEREWLSKEPYMVNKVWEKIDIKPAAVPPKFL